MDGICEGGVMEWGRNGGGGSGGGVDDDDGNFESWFVVDGNDGFDINLGVQIIF